MFFIVCILLQNYFKTISPQGDGNFDTCELTRPYAVFQNHIPARGRKQSSQKLPHLFSRFQNHIPARGRKLPVTGALPWKTYYFKTISPQGDGNPFLSSFHHDQRKIISKPYPRKGTETFKMIRIPCDQTLFQNHIPARGRKQALFERCSRNIENFKTISPQGDGNKSHLVGQTTESMKFQNHIPARGRKRERSYVLSRRGDQFQNHIPARGRSVLPASPARAGEGDRVSGGGGAMNASCKPS